MSNTDVDKALDRIYPNLSTVEASAPPQEDIYIPASDVFTVHHEVMGVPVNKKESKTWIYIVVILVVLVFFFLLIVIAYNYFIQTDNDTTTNETNDINANIGAMLTANEYYAMTGITNKKMVKTSQIILMRKERGDICDYGYYTGDKTQADYCSFQAHSSNYYNVGKFPMTYTKTDIGKHVLSLNYDDVNSDGITGSGARSRNSATYICDHTDGCVGVEYNHETQNASLITSNISATYPSTVISPDLMDNNIKINRPEFDFSNTTQVYLQKKLRPQFTNVVFGYSGSRPLRYYMTHNEEEPDISRYHKRGTVKNIKTGTIRFPNGVKREIMWAPFRIANYGGLVGKYYDSSNTLIYTDNQVGEYNLPLNLQKYDKLYVIYST